ncbi:MAG: hypothetical protein KY445_13015 [Armatimonadetes bacterium]|nr:hypothetical protein [Armatimonadota bacterium]
MAKRGRKTKLELDPTVIERIVLFLKGGNTRRASALASGISEARFYDWMKRGETEEKGEFREFREAVTQAEAEAEVFMVDSIRVAARPHDVVEYETLTLPDKTTRTVEKRKRVHRPEMAIEWLKRRRRAEWGDSLDIRKLDDETLLRLLSRDDPSGAMGK